MLGLLRAPCRVVYVIDEPDVRGFAYGTLPGHPESRRGTLRRPPRPEHLRGVSRRCRRSPGAATWWSKARRARWWRWPSASSPSGICAGSNRALGSPAREQSLCARTHRLDDLAHRRRRRGSSRHPDRRRRARSGGRRRRSRRPARRARPAVGDQRLLPTRPARDEVVGQHARREPRRPRQARGDVEDPGDPGVGFATRRSGPDGSPSPVSASGQAARRVPTHAPLAPAASTAARLRGEAMPPPASTGTDTASKTASSNGSVPRLHVPVTAALGPARDQDVDAGVGRPTRPDSVVYLCDGGDSGVVRLGDPRPVGAETDRQQRGPRGQRVLAAAPTDLRITQSTRPMPNRPLTCRNSAASDAPGRDAAHADHAQTTGGGDRGGQPTAGDPAHRRVDDRYPQAEVPRPGRRQHDLVAKLRAGTSARSA